MAFTGQVASMAAFIQGPITSVTLTPQVGAIQVTVNGSITFGIACTTPTGPIPKADLTTILNQLLVSVPAGIQTSVLGQLNSVAGAIGAV